MGGGALFADLNDGIYVCKAADERDARRVLEDDPLYRAGFIEHDFVVRRWLRRSARGAPQRKRFFCPTQAYGGTAARLLAFERDWLKPA